MAPRATTQAMGSGWYWLTGLAHADLNLISIWVDATIQGWVCLVPRLAFHARTGLDWFRLNSIGERESHLLPGPVPRGALTLKTRDASTIYHAVSIAWTGRFMLGSGF